MKEFFFFIIYLRKKKWSNLSSKVPSDISYLSKLVSLDLSRNDNMRLDDTSLQRLIQNQTKLSELFLVEVDMSLVSPSSFMNFSSSLTSLWLYDCQLKGRLLDNILHLPNIHLLDVSYNHNLTGSLPNYNWTSPLKVLGLFETGFLIDLSNLISNLKSLKKLYFSGCNFVGSYTHTRHFFLTLQKSLLWTSHIITLVVKYHGPFGNVNGSLALLDLSFNNFVGQLSDVTTYLVELSTSNNLHIYIYCGVIVPVMYLHLLHWAWGPCRGP